MHNYNHHKLEIYGLQAIAVGSIILYHAKIIVFDYQLFKGGFVGFDIFFVISGYLITSIILRELITTGSFSFKNFYEKRIIRIYPVLLLLILASFPLAWMYLSPGDMKDYSSSIITSLSLSSNFYFNYSGNLVEEKDVLLRPFLHTWYISTLGQFYILFPFILLLIFKYFRKYLVYILSICLVLSLIFANFESRNDTSFSFYLLPTRVWELLLGSILAYFEIVKQFKIANKKLNLLLPSLGLILIAHSILFYNDKMLHFSFYKLSPIIGVCLIIWFSDKNELITKLLSAKLFVGIGLISYSFYLLHYPIFSFARHINKTLTDLDKSGLIILSLILSLISYIIIEKPIRNKKIEIKKILVLLLISSVFIIFILNIINREVSRFDIKSGMYGINLSKSYNYEFIGNINSKFKIVLFGDSRVAHIMSYFKDISEDKDISFYNVTASACLSLPSIMNYYKHYPTKDAKIFKLIPGCKRLYKNIIKILTENKEKDEPVVVLYNTWFKHLIFNNSTKYNEDLKFNENRYLTSNENKKFYENRDRYEKIIKLILDDIIRLKEMSNAKKKWVIIGKNPGSYNYEFMGFYKCWKKNKSYPRQPYHKVKGCEKKGLIENGAFYHKQKLFKEIASSNYSKEFIYIDNYDLYCDETYCHNFTNQNKLIYKDHGHFTYEGSKKIVKKIIDEVNKINLNFSTANLNN